MANETSIDLDRDVHERLRDLAGEEKQTTAVLEELIDEAERRRNGGPGTDRWPANDFY